MFPPQKAKSVISGRQRGSSTTGLIQKLEDAEIVSKSEALSPREKEIALLRYDPNYFVHRT